MLYRRTIRYATWRARPLTVLLCAAFLASLSIASARTPEAGPALEGAGVRGGLVVLVGLGDGALAARLGASERFLVHGLDRDAARIEEVRRSIRSRGLYGKVAVETWKGGRLPYTDGIVNLLVARDSSGLVAAEVSRVLAPGGVAWALEEDRWRKTVKARPAGIDEWTHALYDASGNAVARDEVVAPPHHVQWIGHPRNARHHERLASISVVVSAAGRLYSIVDEAPTASILIPPSWSLLARDAFNGVVLWRRSISEWEPYLRGFRSGPHELSRRLVASGETVYVTLGFAAPVAALDGATGETIKTYEGTEGTQEILHREDRLCLVVSDDSPRSDRAESRDIVTLDAGTGRLLWKRSGAGPLPMTVAADGGRVAYLDPSGVVCLDADSGAEVWRTERQVARKRPSWSVATLVISDGVVLCADRQEEPGPHVDESTGKPVAAWLCEGGGVGDLIAYSASTGDVLWSCRAAETYHAPMDVFVNDGLVWVGQSRARTGPDFTVARDLGTGEVRRRIRPDLAFKTTMPHHRCHRNRATSRFLITGRTGVEFIDTRSGDAFRHHWIRGVCQYGFLPCNGLLYVPPHSCACYIDAKMTGFLALRANVSEGTAVERLAVGPAFDPDRPVSRERAGAGAKTGRAADWPTFRADAGRSGGTEMPLAPSLSVFWEERPAMGAGAVRQAGARRGLTSPVVAEGLVLVACVDEHAVVALDAANGESRWRFTAAGRVDSPPTVAEGRAVFGCADGRVYCLRLEDGKLEWRFLAAPEDRRVVAFGQLESAWPVHGSVLVRDGVVTCAAGRSSYLDGGITLSRLDLRTGQRLGQRKLYSRDPQTGEQPEEPMSFEMPGALPDVLAWDGELVTMRHLGFDPSDLRQRDPGPHLFSPAGFLNGDWWHRTYWVFGTHFYSGYIGWYFAGRELPAGRLLVVDDTSIYGFSYKPDFYRGSTGREYHLFRLDRNDQSPAPPPDYQRASREYAPRAKVQTRMKLRWSRNVPCLARAMLRAKDTLFLAGPPEAALRSREVLEGKEGGILCAVSAKDGTTLARYKLDGVPVFDGMAAARGRLYVSMEDGRILCLGDGSQAPGSRNLPLFEAPEPPARPAGSSQDSSGQGL